MKLEELIGTFPNADRRMAVAELRHEVIDLIQASLDESGKNQSELADELGLSRSAVSQVLLGDGNLRIATLAEYLHALGKKVRLVDVPLSEGAMESFYSGYFSYDLVHPKSIASASEALEMKQQTRFRLVYEDFSDIAFTTKTFNVLRGVNNSENVGAA